jgi:hypothetical protein
MAYYSQLADGITLPVPGAFRGAGSSAATKAS